MIQKQNVVVGSADDGFNFLMMCTNNLTPVVSGLIIVNNLFELPVNTGVALNAELPKDGSALPAWDQKLYLSAGEYKPHASQSGVTSVPGNSGVTILDLTPIPAKCIATNNFAWKQGAGDDLDIMVETVIGSVLTYTRIATFTPVNIDASGRGTYQCGADFYFTPGTIVFLNGF